MVYRVLRIKATSHIVSVCVCLCKCFARTHATITYIALGAAAATTTTSTSTAAAAELTQIKILKAFADAAARECKRSQWNLGARAERGRHVVGREADAYIERSLGITECLCARALMRYIESILAEN